MRMDADIQGTPTACAAGDASPPRSAVGVRAAWGEMTRELWNYRHLLYMLTWRDIRIRYKQSVMGLAWAMFMPLLYVGAGLVISRVARFDTGSVPYPLFMLVGVLPWTFFLASLRFGTASLVSNMNLVTKIYFPREVFPLSAIGACLVDFLIGAVLVAGAVGYYAVQGRATLNAWALATPAVLIVQLMLTSGLALLLSMANLYFRDVKYILEAILTVGVFATAVYYPLGGWFELNPMTPVLNAYRDLLCYGRPPGATFAVVAAGSAALLAGAWWAFHQAEFTFAENI